MTSTPDTVTYTHMLVPYTTKLDTQYGSGLETILMFAHVYV